MSTTEEATQDKLKLEDKILMLISEFEAEHKIVVNSISIDRVHIRNYGDGKSQSILSGVSVEVTLP